MKKLIIALLSILTMNAWAQKQTVQIKTSAQCEMCKERIEQEMQFTKGVTAVNLNVESKILTVTYNSKKNNVDKIREIISNLGYDADSVKANKEAHDNLPKCCQNPDFEKP